MRSVVVDEARRVWMAVAGQRQFRRIDVVGEGARLLGGLSVRGRGRIELGSDVLLDGRRAPIELVVERGAVLRIGNGVRIAGGASIEAAAGVTIGDNVRIGAFCKLLDNQLHPLRGDRHRGAPPSRPVVLEDDVELEERVILLPGAHVQRGTTVARGTVVSRMVPPDVVIAGVTPRVVRRKTTGQVDS